MRLFARFLMAVLLLVHPVLQAAQEDAIVFSTAPTHSKDETISLYTPLMNYLSQVTGKTFIIDPAANFIEYSVRMRQGKYDMLFDDSHLTGWRMVNMNHTPLVRLPGTIKVVVAADKASRLSSMQDLEGGFTRACAFASPNMLTLAFLSYFPNPARQPNLIRTRDFSELLQCQRSHHGEALVLSEKLWGELPDEDRSTMKLIAKPERGYPERTFSVSPKIGRELRKQIAEALLSEEGTKVSKALLA